MATVVAQTPLESHESSILRDAEEAYGNAVQAKNSGRVMCVLCVVSSAVTAFFIIGGFGVLMEACCAAAASLFFTLAIYFFVSSHLLHIQAAVLRVGAQVRNCR